jgi:hypothetical protein
VKLFGRALPQGVRGFAQRNCRANASGDVSAETLLRKLDLFFHIPGYPPPFGKPCLEGCAGDGGRQLFQFAPLRIRQPRWLGDAMTHPAQYGFLFGCPELGAKGGWI